MNLMEKMKAITQLSQKANLFEIEAPRQYSASNIQKQGYKANITLSINKILFSVNRNYKQFTENENFKYHILLTENKI